MGNKKVTKIIVSCSGKFHAFALAEQLERHGMLDILFTSYSSIKNPVAKYLVSRRDKEVIPKKRIKTFLPVAFGLKLGRSSYLWNDLFDRWVAWQIRKSNAKVFIGWSSMSLHSIKAAKKKGMIIIVERGSSHILYQNNILKEEYEKYGINFQINPKIIAKELSEYNDADYISIPSTFAKESFVINNIAKNKLIQNPYGASAFFNNKFQKDKNSKFIILYLGTLSIRKGMRYLFEAINKLNISKNDFEVWFIGNVHPEIKQEFNNNIKENWKVFGHIPHHTLSELITVCDIAIQPSLEEGLSMVIPQLMQSGIPVIATTNTGAQDLIIDNINGFIVDIQDSNSISKTIELLFNDPKLLENTRLNLKQSNSLYTWNNYGHRYVGFLNSIVS